jgi:mRNA interferase RelE/StbE
VICLFKKTFLRDLVELPPSYRKKIERLVFEEIPGWKEFSKRIDIKKIQGYENYYRMRVGNYRIGCQVEAGNKVTFYRVKSRKDIYRVFP